GRDHVDDRALYQSVSLHAAQRLREHLLGNPIDLAPQLAVAQWAVEQRVDDQAGPLVGQPVESLSGLAVLVQHVGDDSLVARGRHATSLSVPQGTCKYLLVVR